MTKTKVQWTILNWQGKFLDSIASIENYQSLPGKQLQKLWFEPLHRTEKGDWNCITGIIRNRTSTKQCIRRSKTYIYPIIFCIYQSEPTKSEHNQQSTYNNKHYRQHSTIDTLQWTLCNQHRQQSTHTIYQTFYSILRKIKVSQFFIHLFCMH